MVITLFSVWQCFCIAVSTILSIHPTCLSLKTLPCNCMHRQFRRRRCSATSLHAVSDSIRIVHVRCGVFCITVFTVISMCFVRRDVALQRLLIAKPRIWWLSHCFLYDNVIILPFPTCCLYIPAACPWKPAVHLYASPISQKTLQCNTPAPSQHKKIFAIILTKFTASLPFLKNYIHFCLTALLPNVCVSIILVLIAGKYCRMLPLIAWGARSVLWRSLSHCRESVLFHNNRLSQWWEHPLLWNNKLSHCWECRLSLDNGVSQWWERVYFIAISVLVDEKAFCIETNPFSMVRNVFACLQHTFSLLRILFALLTLTFSVMRKAIVL